MRCDQRWTGWDLLIAVLIALIVVGDMMLAVKIVEVSIEDAEVQAVMEEAGARIEAYYASLPARERPGASTPPAPSGPPPLSRGADEEESPRHCVALPPLTRGADEEVQATEGRVETPLPDALYDVLVESCRTHGVPLGLGLGLIEVESGFRVDADNGLCYGLCQLNRGYFPAALSPADNIRAGMSYLGSLLEQYEGDTAAALRAYNRGHDDGERGYSEAVMAAAGRWGPW